MGLLMCLVSLGEQPESRERGTNSTYCTSTHWSSESEAVETVLQLEKTFLNKKLDNFTCKCAYGVHGVLLMFHLVGRPWKEANLECRETLGGSWGSRCICKGTYKCGILTG